MAMRVILLPQQNYDVAMSVFAAYCSNGVPPENLRALADTYEFFAAAKEFDPAALSPVGPTDLGAAKITSIGPKGVGLELVPQSEAAYVPEEMQTPRGDQ